MDSARRASEWRLPGGDVRIELVKANAPMAVLEDLT